MGLTNKRANPFHRQPYGPERLSKEAEVIRSARKKICQASMRRAFYIESIAQRITSDRDYQKLYTHILHHFAILPILLFLFVLIQYATTWLHPAKDMWTHLDLFALRLIGLFLIVLVVGVVFATVFQTAFTVGRRLRRSIRR